jgi:outer membrane murein-binding lipoprotein Lpp
MRLRSLARAALGLPLAAALCIATARAEDGLPPEVQAQIDALVRQNEDLRTSVERLESEVRDARDEARAARDEASRPAAAAAGPAAATDGALLQRGVGPARLQLLDVSLDVLGAAGWSGADDEQLEVLQGGGHDPRQRGFTLQQAELSFLGAVDPFFDAQAHLIYFIDPEGESRFELEEAFATTRTLPFGLAERGLQLELGQFFTEFGRINPQHPHQWDWQDQPVVNSRFFGEDGMRQTGMRLGWLLPVPWFSELHLGAQNAKGETMVSFLSSDEAAEERAISGYPFAERGVDNPTDLLYLARWVNGVDLGDTVSAQLGASVVHGPNATGNDADTTIAGADLVVKWRPLSTDRGWPFLIFQSEVMGRSYEAQGSTLCLEEEECLDPLSIPKRRLHDWGFYAQLLWGFQRNWALGFRGEHARGLDKSFDLEAGTFVDASQDPFRDRRTRLSPLLVFHPSEFSRIRLQANYDWTEAPELDDALSVWAGIEFLIGAHPAHSY